MKKLTSTRVTTSLSTVREAPTWSKKTANGIQEAFAQFGDANYSPDLSYFQAILVTSGMNDNRDVFLPREMFQTFTYARQKPIDIEHLVEENNSILQDIEKKGDITFHFGTTNTIIGVIYDAALVMPTGDMIVASEYTPDMLQQYAGALDEAETNIMWGPRYHIVVAACLWRFVFPETVHDVMGRIRNKEMALSMEVFFSDWDFLMDNKIVDGTDHEEVQMMYDQRQTVGAHPIGRVIRMPLWGGGGLTATPANPYGFSFVEVTDPRSSGERKTLAKASLVSVVKAEASQDEISTQESKTTQGEQTNMEDLKVVLARLDELVSTNTKLQTNLDTTKASLDTATAKATELEAAKSDLEGKLATATDEATKAANRIKELEAEVEASKGAQEKATELQEKVASLETQIAEQTETVANAKEAQEKLATIEAEKLAASRKTKLEEAKLYIEKLDTPETLVKLSEEEFETIVAARTEIKESLVKESASSKNDKEDGVPFLEGQKDAKKATASVAGSEAKGDPENPFLNLTP